jgi:hypothetical protein
MRDASGWRDGPTGCIASNVEYRRRVIRWWLPTRCVGKNACDYMRIGTGDTGCREDESEVGRRASWLLWKYEGRRAGVMRGKRARTVRGVAVQAWLGPPVYWQSMYRTRRRGKDAHQSKGKIWFEGVERTLAMDGVEENARVACALALGMMGDGRGKTGRDEAIQRGRCADGRFGG